VILLTLSGNSVSLIERNLTGCLAKVKRNAQLGENAPFQSLKAATRGPNVQLGRVGAPRPLHVAQHVPAAAGRALIPPHVAVTAVVRPTGEMASLKGQGVEQGLAVQHVPPDVVTAGRIGHRENYWSYDRQRLEWLHQTVSKFCTDLATPTTQINLRLRSQNVNGTLQFSCLCVSPDLAPVHL
jgi:hypothetical protein